MDTAGARALKERIEQRLQWQEAPAVGEGRQPAADPDAAKLESFEGDERRYHAETRIQVIDGEHKLVTSRVVKRIIDDSWESEVVIEHVEVASAPAMTVQY